MSGTCVTRRSGSTLRAVARGCRLVDPASGLHVEFDGRLTVTTPFAICNDLQVPIDAQRTYRFEDFSAVLSDGDGVVESFSTARFVETALPLRTGCDRADATFDLDGAVALRQRGGIDATLRADGLRIERRASGTAGQCAQRLEASGGLRVGDVAVALDGLAVAVDAAGGVRAIDGGLGLECAPPVRIVTEEALAPADGCARAGQLALGRSDGTRGLLRFSAGGLAIDADADGTAERSVTDCRDPSLARCP